METEQTWRKNRKIKLKAEPTGGGKKKKAEVSRFFLSLLSLSLSPPVPRAYPFYFTLSPSLAAPLLPHTLGPCLANGIEK
uniref:Uncharacterized protein n=1 Tax=Oryza glumipatula TaxID=40148 RepID=A0A0E0BSB9_9ORYZ